ncbi:MAG: type II secretion system F family protein [Vulcanimicrobiota bacterium]
MPTFQFDAVDNRGQAVSGEETAKNIGELADRLRRADFTIIDIRENQEFGRWVLRRLGYRQRLPLYPVAVMMRQFGTMIRAGIPMLSALDILSYQGLHSKVDLTMQAIRKDVEEGHNLSQAFDNRGPLFPPITVPLLRAGEVSGQLDEMVERLAAHMERELGLARAWYQAAAYPAFIFLFCSVVTLGLVTHIFPTFIGMFKGLQVDLPLATRALVTITETVRNPVVILPLILGLLCGAYLLSIHFRSPVGRRQWDWLKLEAPYLGPLAKKIAFARIARTLGVLLASGVTTLAAVRVAGFAAANSVVKDALDRVVHVMKQGGKLSEQLAQSELFPKIFVQLVEVGEESGDLPGQLMGLGDFFEEEVEVALAVFTSLLEPVMIIVMGSIVMFVLVAVFQPVYQLMSLF